MTKSEMDLLRRALGLLRRLVPDGDEPHAVDSPRRCPVAKFALRYLIRDPATAMTSAEHWTFYAEVAAAGELEPLSKSEFLRRLPGTMEATLGVNKSHHVARAGHRLRGFRGIGIRRDTIPPTVVELEPDAG